MILKEFVGSNTKRRYSCIIFYFWFSWQSTYNFFTDLADLIQTENSFNLLSLARRLVLLHSKIIRFFFTIPDQISKYEHLSSFPYGNSFCLAALWFDTYWKNKTSASALVPVMISIKWHLMMDAFQLHEILFLSFQEARFW